MSETAQMTGGPLDGQTVELHPVQQQNGEYGDLCGMDTNPGEPAYVRDGHGRWVWQGKPWLTD
ncbi:hypothetical protein OG696_40625 [Streptomyces sp. NBC_00656]|uniref:hypothetical protein n=1 Tax=Streptomyces sp. NBC_00656 TaxID=2903668 RepID=UPI003249F35E